MKCWAVLELEPGGWDEMSLRALLEVGLRYLQVELRPCIDRATWTRHDLTVDVEVHIDTPDEEHLRACLRGVRIGVQRAGLSPTGKPWAITWQPQT